MKTTAAAVVLVAAAASPALANIFPIEPVGTTRWQAGTNENVRWNDDGKAPSLASLGRIDIALYTGGQTQQTFLQSLGTVDANAETIRVRIPADVGPNGQFYFLRFRQSGADNTNDVYSTRFTMTGMTGTFNSTVQAQISGLPASVTGGVTGAVSSGAPSATSSGFSRSSSVTASGSARSSAATPSQTGAATMSYKTAAGAVFAAVLGAAVLFA